MSTAMSWALVAVLSFLVLLALVGAIVVGDYVGHWFARRRIARQWKNLGR
jgi:uncharacterized protein YneF (UPF0154 family)